VTGGFEHFAHGKASVAITGRIYHRIFDITRPHHSMQWFIHDENSCNTEGIAWNVPLDWIDGVRNDLLNVNPYLHHLRHFHNSYSTDNTSLEILDTTTVPDFVVLVHASNTTAVRPRSILIWNKMELEPSFVPIHS